MIRESALTSITLDALSHGAERFFWHLVLVADDYGRFNADPRVLLARCFPLRVARTRLDQVVGWWNELVDTKTVTPYRHGENFYGYFPAWDKHQKLRRGVPRFPDPPDMPSIGAERGIHDSLYSVLAERKTFCGHEVLSVERNIRTGNGFADLVIATRRGRIVIEVKRTRADAGAIRQVSGYMAILTDCIGGVVVATGLGPTVGISHFEKANIALISYGLDGTTTLLAKTPEIQRCDLVIPVISQDRHGKSLSARSGDGDEDGDGDGDGDGQNELAPAEPSPGTESWKLAPDLEAALRGTRFERLAGDRRWWQAEFRLHAEHSLRFETELRRAEAWCASNPGRAPKKDVRRFLHAWFERANGANA